ncbi:MAG TPA: hypothetical protein ACFCUD_00525 [Cyclobacteriaceae bacterium]
MRNWFYAIVLMAFVACSEEEDRVFDPEGTYIRVENISDYNYENVVVNTSGGDNNYGDISSGAVSDYRLFGFAYRYAFVELQIDGDTATILPFDYVGEAQLDPGLYTYRLDAADTVIRFGRLSLLLVED